ncbi:MAG: hypothetical protein FWF59_14910 [Turicibacter sp.]|nr:hypothetical protein [Turicibacter sp.]
MLKQGNLEAVGLQPVKIEEWLVLILVGLIPGINLIVMGILSFRKKSDPNRRNFARAAFGFLVVLTVLLVLGLFM